MIPILYTSTATNFSNNGIGVLTDTASCIVTEERNGSYECEFSYPITGIYYSEIMPDRIIKVKASEYNGEQLFRVYRATKPINGIVKFYAQHISYDLNTIPVNPFAISAVNATTALSQIFSHCFYNHRFSGTSTVTTVGNYSVTTPKSARNCLGGSKGSMLDVYGGEFEFDNFLVKLHRQRGQDNGVTILYGKNLTDIESDINVQSTFTSIYPYAIDADGDIHTLTEKVIELQSHSDYGEPRTLIIDLSDKFNIEEENITETKLRQVATAYANNNKIDGIDNNIKISFAQLWQSEEYQTISLLERVGLCDTVTVKYEALGVSVKAKVIKTVYNTLTEKYEKMELGNARSKFGDSFITTKDGRQIIDAVQRNDRSATEKAIEEATELITGSKGGYVIIGQDQTTGYPEEILIMDTADKQTAVNVWRFNSGGLGHSSTGYNGPFSDIALTANGKINASMITAGVLNADLIKTGTIQDTNNRMAINMTSGKITMSVSSNELEIWTNGVTIKSDQDEVLTSMFASANKKGVLTANYVYIGTRTSEKIEIDGIQGKINLINNNSIVGSYSINANNKSVLESDKVYTNEINSKDGLVVKIPHSSSEYGYDLTYNNSLVGSFYVNSDGKAMLKTAGLIVDNHQYAERSITINGTTYHILSRV